MSYRIVAKEFALEVDNEWELRIALRLLYADGTLPATKDSVGGSQPRAAKNIRRRLREIEKSK